MENCTMLVNSCDNYSDVWYPFFKILKAQWPDLSMPIVLNTESKKIKSIDGLPITTLNVLKEKKINIPWGERLIDVLNRISSEYILFMLDDFLLQEPVNTNIIENCLNWMKQDTDIVTFTLVPSGYYEQGYEGKTYSPYSGFGLREGKDNRLVAVPGIWRRDKLISVIRPFEDPWVWETYGSMRERRNKGKFYGCKLNAPQAFVYDIKRGGAIHRGLWVGCTVRPLLQKYNIDIDLDIRGVDEDWLKHPVQYKKFDIPRIIKNRSKMIRSLFF